MRFFMPALGTDAVPGGSGAGLISASTTTALTCTTAASLSAPLVSSIAAAFHEILVIHTLFLIWEAVRIIPDTASPRLLLKFIDVLMDIF
jgi:hypothetical protein